MLPTNKNSSGPIARALIDVANKNDIELIYFDNFTDKYENVIVFHNHPETIPQLNAQTGWWMCDYRPPDIFETPKVDKIFLCNLEYAEQYKKRFNKDVFYVPQCGHSEQILKGRKIEWDIVFIGNTFPFPYHANRKPIIERLKKEYILKVVDNDKYTKDTAWIYNKTPISLSISPQGNCYTSNRLYNILASKGFCLTLWFPGIEKLFINHKHLVWFKNIDEAKKLIRYYLTNPVKRDKIRSEGYRLYVQRHTAEHRLLNMFDILKGDTPHSKIFL